MANPKWISSDQVEVVEKTTKTSVYSISELKAQLDQKIHVVGIKRQVVEQLEQEIAELTETITNLLNDPKRPEPKEVKAGELQ